MQLLLSFAATFSIRWPRVFNQILEQLRFLTIDFLRLPSIACIRPDIVYYDKFLGSLPDTSLSHTSPSLLICVLLTSRNYVASYI